MAQLPEGTIITKVYRGAENGTLRVIVLLPGEPCETRYILEDGVLVHRP
jgi:hypothetical protein